MKCPICNSKDTGVTNSRLRSTNHISRRRKCFSCDHRFTTAETIVSHIKGDKKKTYDEALVLENERLIKELKKIKDFILKINVDR